MIYKEFCVSEERKKKPEESIMGFIRRFVKMAQRAEKNKIKFGKVVLSFKILEAAAASEELPGGGLLCSGLVVVVDKTNLDVFRRG